MDNLETDNQSEVYHWKDLQGNPYNVKPEIGMYYLNQVLTVKCLLKGQPRNKQLSQYRQVIYDKEYVLSYIASRIISPLSCSKDILETILKDAIETHYSKSSALDKAETSQKRLNKDDAVTQAKKLLKAKKSKAETIERLLTAIYDSEIKLTDD